MIARAAVVPLLSLLLLACDERAPPAPAPVTTLQQALGGSVDAGFARATQVREFEFPRDHGAHPHYRNEWWYFTGVLGESGGRRFGFQLTFFRVALRPPAVDASTGPALPGWRSEQVWFAHFAVSDPQAAAFHAFERFSRPARGLAGARAAPFAVWLDDWRVGGDGTWTLSARERGVALTLSLQPRRAPVLNGEQGLSRKSAAAGNASYYYSMPRIAAEGELQVGARRHAVQGLVWLDREWSTQALDEDQVGWDWFSLHLEDGSNLMYYRLRTRDGRTHPYSGGTWSFADGRELPLDAGAMQLRPLRYWRSARGGRYPVAWELVLPAHRTRLEVRALLDRQWLDFLVPYWEGIVAVSGERAGAPLGGEGYLELTGYDAAAAP